MYSLCHVRNKIMHVPLWRTVYALTPVLFWCLFPSLLRNSGNKHQNNPHVCASTFSHASTYIILYNRNTYTVKTTSLYWNGTQYLSSSANSSFLADDFTHWYQRQYFLVEVTLTPVNTLRPRQNGCHFADDILKMHCHQWKIIHFNWNYTAICSYGFNEQYFGICFDNGWCMYELLGPNELTHLSWNKLVAIFPGDIS